MFERVYFETAGTGYWSTATKEVDIEDIKLRWVSEDKDYGELAVYFDTGDWDVGIDGLIYTDPLFAEQLRKFLNKHGLAGDDVSYSEQGMQGEDYVSLDVGEDFINSWVAKFGEASIKEITW